MNNFKFEPQTTIETGPPRWMMSFADLMSVILTFFVLIFSMSAPAAKSSAEVNLTGSEEAAFSVDRGNVQTKIKTAVTDQDLSTNYIADIIKERMAAYPELADAE